jgi:hypothetical protein
MHVIGGPVASLLVWLLSLWVAVHVLMVGREYPRVVMAALFFASTGYIFFTRAFNLSNGGPNSDVLLIWRSLYEKPFRQMLADQFAFLGALCAKCKSSRLARRSTRQNGK